LGHNCVVHDGPLLAEVFLLLLSTAPVIVVVVIIVIVDVVGLLRAVAPVSA
jgi:hypothetical protein